MYSTGKTPEFLNVMQDSNILPASRGFKDLNTSATFRNTAPREYSEAEFICTNDKM
jgi:hypothetical protein